jgi:hypothetical protein
MIFTSSGAVKESQQVIEIDGNYQMNRWDILASDKDTTVDDFCSRLENNL